MALTEKQIFDAADDLRRDGQKVTVRALRERLGEYGSFETIHASYKRWMESNERLEKVDEPIPRALADRAMHLAESAWADALAGANKVVAEERIALKNRQERLDAEVEELILLVDKGEIEVERLRQEVSRLNEALLSARTELSAADARVDEREQALSAERAERQSVQRELTEALVLVERLKSKASD